MIQSLDRAELRQVNVGSYEPDNYIAIWNVSRDKLEGIVDRKNSTLIQHKDAFDSFIRVAREKRVEVSGILKNFGGNVIIEATFKNVNLEDPTGSNINLGVRLENNYDKRGMPCFEGQGFGIRAVCSNGMIIRDVVSKLFKKHEKVADLDKGLLEFIDIIMTSGVKLLKDTIENANKDVFTNAKDVIEVMRGEIFSNRISSEIEETLETKDGISRYTIYNSITMYATHRAKDERERVSLHRIAERILIKPKSELRRKSLEDEY